MWDSLISLFFQTSLKCALTFACSQMIIAQLTRGCFGHESMDLDMVSIYPEFLNMIATLECSGPLYSWLLLLLVYLSCTTSL